MEKEDNLSRYPLLAKVKSPADIRSFSIGQLEQLCAEIRGFLIDEVSANPGHFASSMGAVELTVALHYVFDTPRDRIVWDVGHQAYGHKLLTGRADCFGDNRKLGGLSGFPNPEESEYDTFTAGHASNSISAALGMSVASTLKGEAPRRNVVAVIGDAAISGGLAFEGLNNAANAHSNLLIILNDNDMSIDRNVGSLNSYLAHITASKSYNAIRYKAYKMMKRLKLVSERRRGLILRFNNSLKSLLTREQNIFEGLNIRYFGPFDGHDLQRIIRVLTDIKDMDGPRLLHLRTVKGKGYAPAEKDPSVWHAPGKFDPKTGERKKATDADQRPFKYQDVMGMALVELAKRDDAIVGITAAMPSGTSMSRMLTAFPSRTFDVGISEGHAVTFAGGLAKDGLRPFVAIYSSFLQRAYDHIIHDVAIQKLPVVFCIDRAGLVGEDGVTHHGTFDLSYMRAIPNMTVSAPRDDEALVRLMVTAAMHDGPFSIRYPRGEGNIPAPEFMKLFKEVFDGTSIEQEALPIGRGEKLAEGDGAIVMSIGAIAKDAALGVAKAAEKGVRASHYDMIFIKPLDQSIIDEAGRSGKPIVTVEDGSIAGGLASAVMEALAAKGYNNKVTAVGIPDKFIPHGTVAELKKMCGLDADSICQTIIKAASE